MTTALPPDGRALSVVALVVAALVALPAGTAVVSGQGSQVVVQSATVSPTRPQVGELTTVTATIKNFESSSEAAKLTSVSLRSNAGVLASAKDPGTLGPGGSLELPLTTAFDTPGRKHLTVWVAGQNENGAVFNVRYPLTVEVEEADENVQLAITTQEQPSTETGVNVTIANGERENISDLQLALSGPDATVEDPRRLKASLAGGAEHTVAYDVAFAGAGRRRLTATLTYRTADGDQRTVSDTATLTVEPARVDAELDAEVVRENETARIDATLTNFGNVPLEEVRLRATVDGETVARKLVPDVDPESSRTVSVSESSLPAGDVQLTATYEAAGERHSVARSVRFAPTIHGNITLTGIEVSRVGGTVTLTGSASNVGETAVTGAVVAVVDTEDVTPVSPAKDYFVGNVPAGEFTSFELTARLDSNRTDAIPIRVSYIADGEQHSRVVTTTIADGGAASVRGPSSATDGSAGPRGPFSAFGRIDLVGILVRVALLVVVLGGTVYWWRRRRSSDDVP